MMTAVGCLAVLGVIVALFETISILFTNHTL
jgi:hypothetical protein